MRSLKSRLIIGMAGGMIALLIGFDLIVYNVIARVLWSQFDASLKSAADVMSASVEWDNELDLEFDLSMAPDYAEQTAQFYYEIRSEKGQLLQRTAALNEAQHLGFNLDGETVAFKSFRFNDGRPVRAIAMRFIPRSESDLQTDRSAPLVLTLARGTERILAHLRLLRNVFVTATVFLAGFSCVTAAGIVKTTVTPLTAVAAQIEGIGHENLDTRITGDNLPSEVALIQNRVNGLLSRLADSFEREKSFNADLAHELRTPLAGLRSIIDVTLSKERSADQYRTAMTDMRPIVDGMKEMASRLLMLTKIESGQMAFSQQPVQIAAIIDQCWLSLKTRAAEARLVFENNLAADVVCQSDTAALMIVFSNLLDNAIEYTNAGGRIWVTSEQREHDIEIILENTGNVLSQEQVRKVLDCYWRGDASRKPGSDHYGLGLFLVKRILHLLGGDIRANVSNGLFGVYVSLPMASVD